MEESESEHEKSAKTESEFTPPRFGPSNFFEIASQSKIKVIFLFPIVWIILSSIVNAFNAPKLTIEVRLFEITSAFSNQSTPSAASRIRLYERLDLAKQPMRRLLMSQAFLREIRTYQGTELCPAPFSKILQFFGMPSDFLLVKIESLVPFKIRYPSLQSRRNFQQQRRSVTATHVPGSVLLRLVISLPCEQDKNNILPGLVDFFSEINTADEILQLQYLEAIELAKATLSGFLQLRDDTNILVIDDNAESQSYNKIIVASIIVSVLIAFGLTHILAVWKFTTRFQSGADIEALGNYYALALIPELKHEKSRSRVLEHVLRICAKITIYF